MGGLHLGGNINLSGNSFDSHPNGVAALIGPDSIPTAGLVQIVLLCGWLEIAFMKDVPGMDNDFDEETKLTKRAIELNNGRAAMLGILGLMVHEEIVPLGYDPDLPIIGHLV